MVENLQKKHARFQTVKNAYHKNKHTLASPCVHTLIRYGLFSQEWWICIKSTVKRYASKVTERRRGEGRRSMRESTEGWVVVRTTGSVLVKVSVLTILCANSDLQHPIPSYHTSYKQQIYCIL